MFMLLLDTHFLINWIDDPEGEDLYDVVSSKMVVPPDDVDDILGVNPGKICKVAYSGGYYKARVLEVGRYMMLHARLQKFDTCTEVMTCRCSCRLSSVHTRLYYNLIKC